MKFLKIESYKIGILLSTFFNIVNKGLVFFSNLVIAYYFGAKTETDVYFFTYNSIALAATFFTSLNSSILVPESMRIREKEGKENAFDFLNMFILFYSAITMLMALVCFLYPFQTFRIISNFDSNALLTHRNILSLTVILMPLMVINNLLSDILTSYKYFTIPMVVGIINGLLALLAIVFLHNTFGILSAVAGLLIANFINLALLVFIMKRNLAWDFRIKLVKVGKRIWGNIGYAQLGNITSIFSSYVPLYFFSGSSAGLITALNFAQQIAGLPNSLITMQFSSVAAIKFNELYAKNELREVNRLFITTGGFLIFILLPISGFFFLFPKEIISIFYKRGAFSGDAIYYASGFLQFLGTLLPMLVINTLLSRMFMASHQIKQSFWYQIICNFILIGLIAFFIKRLGFIGYPLALVVYNFSNVLACLWLCKKYFPFLDYKKMLKDFFILLSCNMIIVITLLFFKSVLSFINIYLLIVIIVVFYGILLLIINEKFNLNHFIKDFSFVIKQKLNFKNESNIR